MIDLHFFNPEFAVKYGEQSIKNLQASGATEAQITNARAEMARLAEMYKNPVLVALFTSLEVLPVGLIVSLICAAILKKKAA